MQPPYPAPRPPRPAEGSRFAADAEAARKDRWIRRSPFEVGQPQVRAADGHGMRTSILLAATLCTLLGACASSGSNGAPAPDETSTPRRSSGGAADPGGREADAGADDAEVATACFSSPDAVLVRDLEPRRAAVSTMFVAGSRLVVGSDQELASFPFTGGRSSATRARSTSPLPTVSGDRVYYVDGISLYWTTPLMDMPAPLRRLLNHIKTR